MFLRWIPAQELEELNNNIVRKTWSVTDFPVKKYKKPIIIFLVLWVLTLGIHIIHTATFWPSNWFEGDRREDFKAGKIDYDLNVSIHAFENKTNGIPFLVQYTTDTAPYSMAFILWTAPDDPIRDVRISRFEISGTPLPHESLVNLEASISKSEDGYSARIKMPDYSGDSTKFNIVVIGEVDTGEKTISFEETLIQEVSWNTDIVLGWYLLILQWAFG